MDMGEIKPPKRWNADIKALEVTKVVVEEANSGLHSDCDRHIDDSKPTVDNLVKLPSIHVVSSFRGNTIPRDKLMMIFDLTRRNMQKLYDENNFDGGWNEKKKLGELKYYRTHILLVSTGKHLPRDVSVNESEVVGFVSYRFLIMREQQPPTPVCYIYELQIRDEYRSQGLGKFLVQLLEIIAKNVSCEKLMCTVLKANHRALKFYREKCHFINDESDPNTSYHVLKGLL